jgi:transglutaminase-like putative cysteine protease
MTNHRMTFAAGIAVIAAALSLYSLLSGNGWMAASIGAVAAVALAGSLTRLAAPRAAIAATVAVVIAVFPPLAGHGGIGLVGGLALVAITALSGTGARSLRLLATLTTYLAVVLFYLNAVFANASSYARLIPSAASLAYLFSLPAKASAEFQYSPPVPTSSAVEFVAAGGVGVIAIAVDILAVRLRRPALAGLPLLLLFSVPVATSLKTFGLSQTLIFGLAIAAYLALLSSDGRQRLRMWGRLVSTRRLQPGSDGSQGPDTRQLAASGRRVGLAAVGLAMLVPVILVGTTPKDIFGKTVGPGESGTAITSGSEVNPLGSVNSELGGRPQTVLTYQTNSRTPSQQYLQEWVLNYQPSSNSWRPDQTGTPQRVRQQYLPDTVPGLGNDVPVAAVRTSITVGEIQDAPLPVPYAPVEISAPGGALSEWPGTLVLFDNQQQLGFHYTVVSEVAEPTQTELNGEAKYPAAIEADYGRYTGPDAGRLYKIALAHTVGAITPLEQAIDLQAWFTSGAFSYSVQSNLNDTGHWLLHFLTTGKSGDCQQFAPAFAILARLLNIPARVAVGYTAGQNSGGLWTVTTADAHAWPELYFPKVGWIRFEPTPGGSAGQGTAVPPKYSVGVPPGAAPPGGVGGTTGAAPVPVPSSNAGNFFAGHRHLPDGDAGGAGVAPRAPSRFPVGAVAGIVVFLLIAWPSVGRQLTTRRRWMTASGDAARAHTAWRELTDYLADYGLAAGPSESPRTLARRVAEVAGLDPAAGEAVTRMSAAEERARYARTAIPAASLRSDVATVRRALAANSGLIQRIRARLLPASTLAGARSGLQAVSHALSWIESPLPSLRRGLRPRPRRAG